MPRSTDLIEFDALRPRLLALLELHRGANTEAARAAIVDLMEQVFLATAWHVAKDLLDNGWRPAVLGNPRRRSGRLKVVGGADAA